MKSASSYLIQDTIDHDDTLCAKKESKIESTSPVQDKMEQDDSKHIKKVSKIVSMEEDCNVHSTPLTLSNKKPGSKTPLSRNVDVDMLQLTFPHNVQLKASCVTPSSKPKVTRSQKRSPIVTSQAEVRKVKKRKEIKDSLQESSLGDDEYMNEFEPITEMERSYVTTFLIKILKRAFSTLLPNQWISNQVTGLDKLLSFLEKDKICAGCYTEIGYGRYLNCLNAVWHPECFRCHSCNLPISDNEETPDRVINRNYIWLPPPDRVINRNYTPFSLATEFVMKDPTLHQQHLRVSAKRKAFDLERWKYFCLECNTIPYTARNSSASKPKGRNHTSQSRSHKILRGLKDIRERFREEAKVIQNCLKTTATSRKESPLFNPPNHSFPSNQKTQKESPVFNPSDYSFQGGYPHLRTRLCKKHENHWYLQTGNVMNCEKGSWRYDIPICEVGLEPAMFRSKSACVRS
ncbi:hypothetical protein SO802_034488 [Lithocarpus litseifolius]|uniref:LIM zinc-binding domain-containing protein n=1 Tax=Lithocarpus litseifolius TaxID=425828 RepID=A0AAW2BHS2_9ROSI